jgi:hypothetical protein
MLVTYDMKLRQIVKNAAIMVLARLPWAILIWGGSMLIPALLLLVIPSNFGLLIFVALYLLIGFAVTGLLYASFANACFDRFLNPRIAGAPVNMGLRDPVYDALDDDEDDG